MYLVDIIFDPAGNLFYLYDTLDIKGNSILICLPVE